MYKRPIDSLKELFLRKDYAETFWALNDVTFELTRGGSLGIIGDNGAGKSTLLKLLAGAAAPTTGRVQRTGRTSAMLSLGAGFHPDLSGTENIRVGCAVLGLSPAETHAITPKIVEFSELGEFIERPVKTYSSGMQLRLGFSVATAIDPDILVVDEHLSVGDQHFRHKCLRRIMDLQNSGCSLVFCSHDLHAVREVCDRTLWLRDGRPTMLAATIEVVDAYQEYVRGQDAETSAPTPKAESPRERPSDNYLLDVRLGGDCRDGVIETGATLELHVTARVSEAAYRDGVQVGLMLVRSDDSVLCSAVTTKWDGLSSGLYLIDGEDYGVRFVIHHLPLLAARYNFTVALMDDRSPHVYDTLRDVVSFTVRSSKKDAGVVQIPHEWKPL
jgi:lipopolysaccharide transport system ATP-binding protein